MTNPRPTIHLLCNAHLDPVWLWPWEEGAAEAVSTFRVAADFCEEFDGFIFNHNEVILYEWVEQYEPALFARIQKLVRQGKWHIAGGWYLQPDCNMPSGEGMARQAIDGLSWFAEKFGVRPRVAYNFDPFGHSRGIAQILARSGFVGYLHCRPNENDTYLHPLPDKNYLWVGPDGSCIASQYMVGYLTHRGQACQRINEMTDQALRDNRPAELVPWGIGNHGGGPSRGDLQEITALIPERSDATIIHSTPEAFFEDLRKNGPALTRYPHDLQRCFPGCYTSQVRIKQQYRRLENIYFTVERMITQAWAAGRIDYPREKLTEARRCMLLCAFHDILPGSSIQAAEEMGLGILARGIDLCEQLRMRAVLALAAGQRKARDGEIPILAMNPQARPVTDIFECEMNLPDQDRSGMYYQPTVTLDGQPLPAQCEKEASNINLEWRKRIVVDAELAPSQISRLDVTFRKIKAKPRPKLCARNGRIRVAGQDLTVDINTRTGLIDSARLGRQQFLAPTACQIVALADDDDSWGTHQHRYPRRGQALRLVSKARARQLNGGVDVEPVQIVENGPVRRVIEATFEHDQTTARVRYLLPQNHPWIDLDISLLAAPPRTMCKLRLPLAFQARQARCQSVYDQPARSLDGTEWPAQKWGAAMEDKGAASRAIAAVNNGTYAFDCTDGELRLNLLRTPCYSFLPPTRQAAVASGLNQPRSDRGERHFRFRLMLGPANTLLRSVEASAQAFNESPFLVSFFPSGQRAKTPKPIVEVRSGHALVTAVKQSIDGKDIIIRLFEPTGRAGKSTLSILGRWQRTIRLGKYELMTLRVDPKTGKTRQVDLMEEPVD